MPFDGFVRSHNKHFGSFSNMWNRVGLGILLGEERLVGGAGLPCSLYVSTDNKLLESVGQKLKKYDRMNAHPSLFQRFKAFIHARCQPHNDITW